MIFVFFIIAINIEYELLFWGVIRSKISNLLIFFLSSQSDYFLLVLHPFALTRRYFLFIVALIEWGKFIVDITI